MFLVFFFLNQINAGLKSIRDYIQNHFKILPTINFWKVVYIQLFWTLENNV